MAQLNDNVLPFSKYAGDVGSGKPPGPPLLPPGGGNGMADLEVRVAVLEADLKNIKSNIADIKSDIKDLRTDIKSLSDKLSSRSMWLLGAGTAATIGLAALMAKGFKWL
jgi:hypothetical protein